MLEGSRTFLRQLCVHEVILPRSRSFPSAFSHFQTLSQYMLTQFCSVLFRSIN